MIYTVRYAHLEKLPPVILQETVTRGQIIGRMGSTGKSSKPHLHIDCVHGSIREPWTQRDMEDCKVCPALRQLYYFIDGELFNSALTVTTGIATREYLENHDLIHMAFDVVPANRYSTDKYYDIHWNRSMIGKVVAVGTHPGYGDYLHIAFSA